MTHPQSVECSREVAPRLSLATLTPRMYSSHAHGIHSREFECDGLAFGSDSKSERHREIMLDLRFSSTKHVISYYLALHTLSLTLDVRSKITALDTERCSQSKHPRTATPENRVKMSRLHRLSRFPEGR